MHAKRGSKVVPILHFDFGRQGPKGADFSPTSLQIVPIAVCLSKSLGRSALQCLKVKDCFSLEGAHLSLF